jgi:hypothetical protein
MVRRAKKLEVEMYEAEVEDETTASGPELAAANAAADTYHAYIDNTLTPNQVGLDDMKHEIQDIEHQVEAREQLETFGQEATQAQQKADNFRSGAYADAQGAL